MNLTVSLSPNPVPTTPVSPLCYQENIEIGLNANDISGAGNTFLWTPAGLLNDAAIAQPNYIPSENPNTISVTTLFEVTVTNSVSGCSGTGSVEVILFRLPVTGPQYHIPNTFGE